MNRLNKFVVFQGRQGKKVPFFVQIRKKGTKFQIRAVVRTDNGGTMKTAWTVLPRASTKINVIWFAANSAGADNGSVGLFINDILKVYKTGVDNDMLYVKNIRLGITAPIKASFNIYGSFRLDAFTSKAITDT